MTHDLDSFVSGKNVGLKVGVKAVFY